jgi:hypothetical protein
MPEEGDDCPVCYDSMHGAGEATLVWCEGCGNALHKGCFTQCACGITRLPLFRCASSSPSPLSLPVAPRYHLRLPLSFLPLAFFQPWSPFTMSRFSSNSETNPELTFYKSCRVEHGTIERERRHLRLVSYQVDLALYWRRRGRVGSPKDNEWVLESGWSWRSESCARYQ